MSLIVRSTSIFRESLYQICRRPKHQYTSCPRDICNELCDKSVQDLLTSNNAILLDNGTRAVVKVRLACESRGSGKSGGFRMIVAVDRNTQEVVMLEVYPKTGALGKSNIDEQEYKHLLNTYFQERNAMLLLEHDLNNTLAHVEAQATTEGNNIA